MPITSNSVLPPLVTLTPMLTSVLTPNLKSANVWMNRPLLFCCCFSSACASWTMTTAVWPSHPKCEHTPCFWLLVASDLPSKWSSTHPGLASGKPFFLKSIDYIAWLDWANSFFPTKSFICLLNLANLLGVLPCVCNSTRSGERSGDYILSSQQ